MRGREGDETGVGLSAALLGVDVDDARGFAAAGGVDGDARAEDLPGAADGGEEAGGVG